MNKQINKLTPLAKDVKLNVDAIYKCEDFLQHPLDDVKKAINQTNSSGASGYDKLTQRMLNSQSKILHLLFNSW